MEHKTFLSSIAIILILPAMYSFNSLALETVENDKSCEALCDYYYNPPVYTTNKDNKDNIDNIIINADKTDLMAAGKFVFRGNVMVQQGARVFYADEAIILRNLDTGKIKNITANGNVKILDPNFNIDGSKIEILFNNNQDQNQDQTRTIIYDAKYTLYHQHASGQADYIIIYGQDIIKMPHAEYTTCNPANKIWHLKTSRVKLNKKTGRGRAWNARLYVKELPLFYWPYVDFAIDSRRKTGFLLPSVDISSNSGQALTIPFYWNIAANKDMTISSQYMTKRGLKLDNLFRYLTHNSAGQITFNFLPNDNELKKLRNTKLQDISFINSSDPNIKKRYHGLDGNSFRYKFAFKNISKFKEHWQLDLDYTRVKDHNYYYDFEDASTQLLQNAKLQYRSTAGIALLNLEQYQTLQPLEGAIGVSQLRKLPEISLDSSQFDLPQNFISNIGVNYTEFKTKSNVAPEDLLSYGNRLYFRPVLSKPMSGNGWFIIPRVQLHNLQYSGVHVSPNDRNLGLGVKPGSSHINIPIYDIKNGLIFERNTTIFKQGFLQTLEPQIYYLYVPNKSQNHLPNFDTSMYNFDYNQVFRDNTYKGLDRVSPANQIGLGVANRLFSSATGQERAMVGVGIIHYLKYQTKQWSPLALMGKVQLTSNWLLESDLIKNSKETKTATLSLQYRRGNNKVFNFGYQLNKNNELNYLNREIENHIKQFQVSAAWKLSAKWQLFGKMDYDLRLHRSLNLLAGVEYHTCCTIIRLGWEQQWLANYSNGVNGRRNNSIRLQFVLKGLTSLGNAQHSYLTSKIPGYNPVGK